MSDIMQIQGAVNKLSMFSQDLRQQITNIDGKDVSTRYYLGNLKRLSLQSLDLFNAMQQQISHLKNIKKNTEIGNVSKQRRVRGLSLE